MLIMMNRTGTVGAPSFGAMGVPTIAPKDGAPTGFELIRVS